MEDKITKVFISYSHDSIEHKEWVLSLYNKLRNDAIDSIIDQADLRAGNNLGSFMNLIEEVDKVLIICTKPYYEKSKSSKGGVAYENYLITAEIIQKLDSGKFIPIIRQDETKDDGNFYIPTSLKNFKYINFSNDYEFENEYKELINTLHDMPSVHKQALGTSPLDLSEENIMKKGTENITEILNKHLIEEEKEKVKYKLIEKSFLNSNLNRNTLLKCGDEYSMFIFALIKLIEKNSLIEESLQYSYQYFKTNYGHCFVIFYQKNNDDLRAYNTVVTLDENCEIKFITTSFNKTIFKFREINYIEIGKINGVNHKLKVLKFQKNIKFEASNGVISRVYKQESINRIISLFEQADNGQIVNQIINKDLSLATKIENPIDWFLIFQFYNNENDYPDRASIWILKEDFKKFIKILQQSIEED